MFACVIEWQSQPPSSVLINVFFFQKILDLSVSKIQVNKYKEGKNVGVKNLIDKQQQSPKIQQSV